MAWCRAPTRREKPVFSPVDENHPPRAPVTLGQLRDHSRFCDWRHCRLDSTRLNSTQPEPRSSSRSVMVDDAMTVYLVTGDLYICTYIRESHVMVRRFVVHSA